MIEDAAIFLALHQAVDSVTRPARQHGPLPSIRSQDWLTAPRIVQQATILVCGEARILEDLAAADMVDQWLGQDYLGGAHHRHNPIPLLGQLDRRRYPPTGRRDLWIRYGPDGPPADLAVVA